MNKKFNFFIGIFLFLCFVSQQIFATALTTANSSFTVNNFGVVTDFTIKGKAWINNATVFGVVDSGAPFEINGVNLLDGEPVAYPAPFPGAYFQAGRFEDYSYDGASLNVYSNVNYYETAKMVFSHGHKIIDPSPTLGANYVEWQPIYQITNVGNVDHTVKTFRYVKHPLSALVVKTYYSKGYDMLYNTNDDYSIFLDGAYNFYNFSGVTPTARSTRLQSAVPTLFNSINTGAANYSLDNSTDDRNGAGESAWMYGPYTLKPNEAIILNYPTQKMLQIYNSTLVDIDYSNVNVSAAVNNNFPGTDVSVNFSSISFIGGQYEAAPAINYNVPNSTDITVVELTGGMIIRNPNPAIGNVSTVRYWEISADTRLKNFMSSITFNYNPVTDKIINENTLKLVRRMSITEQWVEWGNVTRNAVANTIRANGVNEVLGSAANLGQWAFLPVNTAPVTTGQNLNTNEDFSVNNIVLLAIDTDSDPLQYTIVQNPQNGVLTGNAPNLTYIPNANYYGADSFTFKVNDGSLDSNISTVNITVSAINDLPIANNQNRVTPEDTPLDIVLTGSDPIENSPLTYIIIDNPQHGVLSGNGQNLTYIPGSNYNGQDSFEFKVNDGSNDSNIGKIYINVTSVNDIPLAIRQDVATDEDTQLDITLSGEDGDNRELSYFIVPDGPIKGELINNPPNLVYIPDKDFNGTDAFAFYVNNEVSDSDPELITITVNPINDAPFADYLTLEMEENNELDITLTASDPEYDSLAIIIVNNPTHGRLYGNPPNMNYVPNKDFVGTDNFTYKANDGLLDSNHAAVVINVIHVNKKPYANDQNVVTNTNISKDIVLTATDEENDNLTFAIVNPPTQGVLNGVAPNLTYIPNNGYNGPDSFTFRVNDGMDDSNIGMVNIQVNPPVVNPTNNPPTANNQNISTNQNVSAGIALSAIDPEAATLTYTIVNNPSHGVLQGTPPSVTYIPNNGYSGQDSFTYKVNDGVNDSNIATVTIQVNGQGGNDQQIVSDNKKGPCIINSVLSRKRFGKELNNITIFSNKYLLANASTKMIVNKYYEISPILSEHPVLRYILALVVLPLMFIIYNPIMFLLIVLGFVKVYYSVRVKC